MASASTPMQTPINIILIVSQVTIHNVGDAKFGRDPVAPHLHDGVEITRINGPMAGSNYGLAVGSHRHSYPDAKHDSNPTNTTEFGGKS